MTRKNKKRKSLRLLNNICPKKVYGYAECTCDGTSTYVPPECDCMSTNLGFVPECTGGAIQVPPPDCNETSTFVISECSHVVNGATGCTPSSPAWTDCGGFTLG